MIYSVSSCTTRDNAKINSSRENQNKQSLDKVAQKFKQDLADFKMTDDQIPRSLNEYGKLETTPSKKWTSGFFSGTLWLLYDHEQDPELKRLAEYWMRPLEKEKLDSTTHDLGFKIYCSYGNAMKITNDEKYKDIVVIAASTLSTRFEEKVGAIRSWDHHKDVWEYPVIIDNMMNLELLFEAHLLTDNQRFYDIAVKHADTTLKNHFRSDHSSYHVVDYDPSSGDIIKKNTHQGAHHESAWSRGQAWGLYGFTMAYRYTKDEKYLEKAKQIARYIMDHPNLPEDGIPYWDFDAPNIPNEPRDVSAAAILASGLYELQSYAGAEAESYMTFADKIITSLDRDDYHTQAVPFYLDHSVGSIPGNFEIDVPITYADYYYVEALSRKKEL